MRLNYILPKEVELKLESTGLTQRIDEYLKDPSSITLTSRGAIFEEEAFRDIEEVERKGYFKEDPSIPEKIKNLVTNQEANYWITTRGEKEEREKVDLEDIPVLSGYYASLILNKEEIRKGENFGFQTPLELLSVVSAYMVREEMDRFSERGYIWESQVKDGRIFKSQVTGDMNLDLRIFRTDISLYETRDPLGNKSLFRPESDRDRQVVAAYHSTEPVLLAAIIQYVEQEKIKSRIIHKEKYQEFITEIKKSERRIGNATECFDDEGENPFLYFIPNLNPMQRLDLENKVSTEIRPYILYSQHEGQYEIFIGNKGEFTFVVPKKNKDEQKKIVLTIPADEIDELTRSLFMQAKLGLGRTSSNILTTILEYKFSEQFEKDMTRFKKE